MGLTDCGSDQSSCLTPAHQTTPEVLVNTCIWVLSSPSEKPQRLFLLVNTGPLLSRLLELGLAE